MRDDKRRWPNAFVGPRVPIRGESRKSAFRSGVSAFVRRSRCPVNRGIADATSAGGRGGWVVVVPADRGVCQNVPTAFQRPTIPAGSQSELSELHRSVMDV